VNDAVKAHFKPEFIGRISDICRFNKLGDFSFRKIVVKAVSEINQSLTDSGVRVQLSEEVIDHIVALGDKEKLGARPIANIIDRVIKLPLSKAILFGGATSGTVIDAVMANGEIKLRPRETLESTIRTIAQEAEIA